MVCLVGSLTLRNPNQQLISIQELLRVNLEHAQDQSQKAPNSPKTVGSVDVVLFLLQTNI